MLRDDTDNNREIYSITSCDEITEKQYACGENEQHIELSSEEDQEAWLNKCWDDLQFTFSSKELAEKALHGKRVRWNPYRPNRSDGNSNHSLWPYIRNCIVAEFNQAESLYHISAIGECFQDECKIPSYSQYVNQKEHYSAHDRESDLIHHLSVNQTEHMMLWGTKMSVQPPRSTNEITEEFHARDDDDKEAGTFATHHHIEAKQANLPSLSRHADAFTNFTKAHVDVLYQETNEGCRRCNKCDCKRDECCDEDLESSTVKEQEKLKHPVEIKDNNNDISVQKVLVKDLKKSLFERMWKKVVVPLCLEQLSTRGKIQNSLLPQENVEVTSKEIKRLSR